MKTVGQILSIGRKSKNLSISDISIELKISKSTITDLENDNIKNNPDINNKLNEKALVDTTSNSIENSRKSLSQTKNNKSLVIRYDQKPQS